MQGLLDFIKTPEGQGLLSGVFGYAANARKGTPVNNLGRGGLAGLLGYSNALERQDQQAENQWTKQYRQMQMDKAQYDMDRTRAQDAEQARVNQLLQGAFSPVSGSQAIGVDGRGPTADKVPLIGQMPKIDYQALLAQGVPVEKVKALAEAQDFGRSKVARTQEVMGPNGEKMIVQLDDFGNPVGNQMAGYVAPVQVNQGDKITFTTPQAGASFKVGMSPSERDASARGWASNRIAQDRLKFEMSGGVDGGSGQSGLVRQFGKPAAGYRWKPDGTMEAIPGGPADQKASMQDAGRQSVSQVIAELSGYYDQLDQGGGITSTNNRAASNMGAWAGTTGIGQTFGSMFGTKNQSARDAIEQTRPLLMQAIMKATGMSAKQMDSNAELKMYLATATDPTKSLEANRAALARLEEMFGMGAGSLGSGGGNGASGSWGAGKTVKRTGTYNGRKVIEYTDGTVEYGN